MGSLEPATIPFTNKCLRGLAGGQVLSSQVFLSIEP